MVSPPGSPNLSLMDFMSILKEQMAAFRLDNFHMNALKKNRLPIEKALLKRHFDHRFQNSIFRLLQCGHW